MRFHVPDKWWSEIASAAVHLARQRKRGAPGDALPDLMSGPAADWINKNIPQFQALVVEASHKNPRDAATEVYALEPRLAQLERALGRERALQGFIQRHTFSGPRAFAVRPLSERGERLKALVGRAEARLVRVGARQSNPCGTAMPRQNCFSLGTALVGGAAGGVAAAVAAGALADMRRRQARGNPSSWMVVIRMPTEHGLRMVPWIRGIASRAEAEKIASEEQRRDVYSAYGVQRDPEGYTHGNPLSSNEAGRIFRGASEDLDQALSYGDPHQLARGACNARRYPPRETPSKGSRGQPDPSRDSAIMAEEAYARKAAYDAAARAVRQYGSSAAAIAALTKREKLYRRVDPLEANWVVGLIALIRGGVNPPGARPLKPSWERRDAGPGAAVQCSFCYETVRLYRQHPQRGIMCERCAWGGTAGGAGNPPKELAGGPPPPCRECGIHLSHPSEQVGSAGCHTCATRLGLRWSARAGKYVRPIGKNPRHQVDPVYLRVRLPGGGFVGSPTDSTAMHPSEAATWSPADRERAEAVARWRGGIVETYVSRRNPAGCRRCAGARQVRLGPRMVPCPMCCRRNPLTRAEAEGSLATAAHDVVQAGSSVSSVGRALAAGVASGRARMVYRYGPVNMQDAAHRLWSHAEAVGVGPGVNPPLGQIAQHPMRTAYEVWRLPSQFGGAAPVVGVDDSAMARAGLQHAHEQALAAGYGRGLRFVIYARDAAALKALQSRGGCA